MRMTLSPLVKTVFLLLVCLSAPASVWSADCESLPPGFQLRTLTDGDGPHKYAVFVPRQYAPEKKWPIVLFLHGAGEKGSDGLLPLSGTLAVALEKWPDAPFIAVFPQSEDVTGRLLTGWIASGQDGKRAMSVLEQVERDFSVDPRQRILVGWSMGGYGAWSLAAATPKHWSRVLTMSGGAVPGTVDLHALAAARTPVWAISGKQDPLISPEAAEVLVKELNQLGGDGIFTLLDPAGHNICSTVFACPETFHWLLQSGPAEISQATFAGVKPLPLRTEYYRNCMLHARRISDVVSVRLGNDVLSELASELPSLVPEETLSGTLPDVRRNLGTPSNPVQVALQGLNYRCRLTAVNVSGISGGRLGIDVKFQPIALTIGATSFQSGQHSAEAGPIRIEIGIRQPAILRLEVQPQMKEGKIKLTLLRKSFLFADNNWYITPPDKVEFRSPTYTRDQLTSGIVGGLYQARGQITDQILSVVPGLLKRFEEQLGPRPASSLSKILSPLPALIPELEIAPSAISVNAGGISLLGDVLALSRVPGEPLTLTEPLHWSDVSATGQVSATVALDAVAKLTSLTVAMDKAQVNVLDISDEKFAVLADPAKMQNVFPKVDAGKSGSLRTVLHLLSPMQLTVISPTADVTTEGDVRFLLSADRIGLDVSDERSSANAAPIGRILFKLDQPLVLRKTVGKESGQSDFQLHWEPQSQVSFLEVESFQGSSVPEVDSAAFEKLFHDAWLSWASGHGTQSIARDVLTVGQKQLVLDKFKSRGNHLQIDLKAEKRN